MCLSLSTVCTASDDSTFRSVELLFLSHASHPVPTQPNPEHQPFRLPLYCQHGEERIEEEERKGEPLPFPLPPSLLASFQSVSLSLFLCPWVVPPPPPWRRCSSKIDPRSRQQCPLLCPPLSRFQHSHRETGTLANGTGRERWLM